MSVTITTSYKTGRKNALGHDARAKNRTRKRQKSANKEAMR
jgi:hypothetical protein